MLTQRHLGFRICCTTRSEDGAEAVIISHSDGFFLSAPLHCKASLMARIDHLASEYTLVRHEPDKIRGRLTEAEDRIGIVEDQQGTSQIAEHHRGRS